MATIEDGYYFMFEIGWFIDLLIPTVVRIKDGNLYYVGSKPCDCKDMRPCCIPAGGETECKRLSFHDPALKAFKIADSLLPIHDMDDVEGELERSLENQKMRDKYLNSPAKKQRKAIIERVMNDYQILSTMDGEYSERNGSV